jgi:hypothetical protein
VEVNDDGATVGSSLGEALGDILGPEGEALGTDVTAGDPRARQQRT